jgi:hypothetical protein
VRRFGGDAEQVHQPPDVAARGMGFVEDAVEADGLGWQAELVTDPLRADGLIEPPASGVRE